MQKQLDFSFSNKWGTYSASTYYISSSGSAPLVIFSHGLGAAKEMYRWIIEPIIANGFVLVMFTVPKGLSSGTNVQQIPYGQWPEGIVSCLDALADRVPSQADLNSIACMGHSAGGLASLLVAGRDPRVKRVVALAPPVHSSNLAQVPASCVVPVQIQVGTLDRLHDSAVEYYEGLEAPRKELITISGGDHIQFMDSGMVKMIHGQAALGMQIPYVGNNFATISTEEQHRICQEGFLKWLRE